MYVLQYLIKMQRMKATWQNPNPKMSFCELFLQGVIHTRNIEEIE